MKILNFKLPVRQVKFPDKHLDILFFHTDLRLKKRIGVTSSGVSLRQKSRRNPMPKYVDGFVIPVPERNLAAYRRMAQDAAKILIEYGALEYRECVADHMDVHVGLPFTKGIKIKP